MTNGQNPAPTEPASSQPPQAQTFDKLYPGHNDANFWDFFFPGVYEAWQGWIKFQTMLVNENRLNLADASARKFLAAQMENYFFGEGTQMPQGYTPPRN